MDPRVERVGDPLAKYFTTAALLQFEPARF